MYVLRRIVEYRQLRMRRYVMRESIGTGAERRLQELEQWLERRPSDPRCEPADSIPSRRHARFGVELGALLECSTGGYKVCVLNVSAGGVLVKCPPHLVRGEMAMLTIYDGDERVAYRLPVQAVWAGEQSAGRVVGCAFVGVPACSALPAGHAAA